MINTHALICFVEDNPRLSLKVKAFLPDPDRKLTPGNPNPLVMQVIAL